MPNLIYFYVSDGARQEDVKINWSPATKSTNRYALSIHTEGMFQLWDNLVKNGVFAHAYTFIDSMRGAHGHRKVTQHSTVYSVPHLEDALLFIEPGDVVVARGGFKPWFNVLKEIQNRGNWILFYRANTNRHPWPFWDVILNDLISKPVRAAGRLHFNFSKPVNEDLFYPIVDSEREFDVMLNASHIHVKKGQHRFIRAAIRYRELFGEDISICLPGGFIRSWAKQEILDNIHKYKLNVNMPGGVPRQQLNVLMSKSKFYVHIGAGGQNDRGCLEAMRCGLPVMLSNLRAFAPFEYNHSHAIRVDIADSDDIVAGSARKFLGYITKDGIKDSIYDKVAKYYLQSNGMHEVCVPKMTELFNHIFEIGSPDRKEIGKRYGV